MVILVDGRAPEVADLFSPDLPNHAMLFACLEGRAPGVTLVDDPRRPRSAVVRADYGIAFASTGCAPGFLAEAIGEFRRDRRTWLVRDEERPPPGLPAPDRVVGRIAYDRRRTSPDSLSRWTAGAMEGHALVEIDASLLERCRWKGEVVSALGSVERFARQGRGFCLMAGGTILCEAYALFWGRGTVEIGAITNPDHRGRNLAPLTCSHLVRSCEADAYLTYWSCHETSPASRRVAEKLGYGRIRRYFWHQY